MERHFEVMGWGKVLDGVECVCCGGRDGCVATRLEYDDINGGCFVAVALLFVVPLLILFLPLYFLSLLLLPGAVLF
jgi:hypothetical protein